MVDLDKPDVLDFVTNPGETDSTDTFNRALDAAERDQIAKLTIGRGKVSGFVVGGKLIDMHRGLLLEGLHESACVIFTLGGGDLFKYRPTNQTILGGGMRGMMIVGLSTNEREKEPGAAISIITTADALAGSMEFNTLRITNDVSKSIGDWRYLIKQDGGASKVPGIRGTLLANIAGFGVRADGWAIYTRSGGTKMLNVALAGAGGVHAGVCFTGGDVNFGSPSICDTCCLSNMNIGGVLQMDNARMFTAYVSVAEGFDIDASCADGEIRTQQIGYPYGAGGWIDNRSASVNIFKNGIPMPKQFGTRAKIAALRAFVKAPKPAPVPRTVRMSIGKHVAMVPV